ncbi:MAG: ChaN family lipoprotein [Acidobacteriota bacterium]|nr:ChaN family lipoprotein [Blastocatellia bacterium]MDW8413507.1 ChaN family lipoprotein [Acidobacteriota bacterium]
MKTWTDFESMLAEVADSAVIFLGEQHDDKPTHRLQLAFLEGLSRRRNQVVVAMEMFERDTQPLLDAYLQGRLTETEFLAQSRPWNNYAEDYKPIVEWARKQAKRVVASNAPRRLARLVSIYGPDILQKLELQDRKLVASEISYDRDVYYDRFVEAMGMNPHESGSTLERLFQAQCLKDDTMAETILQILTVLGGARSVIVHINGDFHSAYRLGVVVRTQRRLPQAKIKVISFVPVADIDSVDTTAHEGRADYVVFTLAR